MRISDVVDVNELFQPIYPYVARQVGNAYGRDDGTVLEFGPFAGGIAIELARQYPQLELTVGDDFPGVLDYFESKIKQAELGDRVHLHGFSKTEMPFAEAKFDLVICRGGPFFWDETSRIIQEAHRVLKPRGLLAFGGGFGADTPDELIEQIASLSHDLNRALGKKVLSEAELRGILRDIGLERDTEIDHRHGLWAFIRKS